jgi:hypothetical protein
VTNPFSELWEALDDESMLRSTVAILVLAVSCLAILAIVVIGIIVLGKVHVAFGGAGAGLVLYVGYLWSTANVRKESRRKS